MNGDVWESGELYEAYVGRWSRAGRGPVPGLAGAASPPIVRFWCDDRTCWAIPFFQIAFMHYHAEEQSLLIECSPGTIVVMGPKGWDFCERFCSHKVGLLKADGKDIVAVTMVLRPGPEN